MEEFQREGGVCKGPEVQVNLMQEVSGEGALGRGIARATV
jgi:hypothetical protein